MKILAADGTEIYPRVGCPTEEKLARELYNCQRLLAEVFIEATNVNAPGEHQRYDHENCTSFVRAQRYLVNVGKIYQSDCINHTVRVKDIDDGPSST